MADRFNAPVGAAREYSYDSMNRRFYRLSSLVADHQRGQSDFLQQMAHLRTAARTTRRAALWTGLASGLCTAPFSLGVGAALVGLGCLGWGVARVYGLFCRGEMRATRTEMQRTESWRQEIHRVHDAFRRDPWSFVKHTSAERTKPDPQPPTTRQPLLLRP
jgi:hypothetical protein